MYARDCCCASVPRCPGSARRREAVSEPGQGSHWRRDGMRNHLGLPALAIALVMLVAACGSTASTQAPASGGASAAPANSAAAATPTPEPAAACAQSADANAMQMWERSGGNKGMVD